MAFIGNIAIKISASAAGLKAELGQAHKAVESFAKSVEKTLGTIAILTGGGLIAKLGFDKLKEGFGEFKEGINRIHEMDKEATKLGLTIRDMSTLMTLAGPDFSEDEMKTGLRKMQAAMQDALDPTSEMGKTFAKFGLDPVKMIGAGTMGALHIFADQMQKIATSSERIKMAGILGKTGHTLIPFLSDAKGMAAAMDEAERKGQAITGRMAKDAKAAAVALDDLGDAWTAFKNKLTVAAAPGATKFVSGLERLVSGDVSLAEGAAAILRQPHDLGVAGLKSIVPTGRGPVFDEQGRSFKALANGKIGVELSKERQKAIADENDEIKKEVALWRANAAAMLQAREEQDKYVKAEEERRLKILAPFGAGQTTKTIFGAIQAFGDLFRKGEGNMMRRQEEGVTAIAAGLLGAPSMSLPSAALYGSQEASDFFAQAKEPAKDMSQAVKEAFAEAKWKQDLAEKLAIEVQKQMPQTPVIAMDGGPI